MTAIADKLEMNSNEVEDLLLEGNQVSTCIQSYISNSGHCFSWKQWTTSLPQMERGIY